MSDSEPHSLIDELEKALSFLNDIDSDKFEDDTKLSLACVHVCLLNSLALITGDTPSEINERAIQK